MEKDILVKKSIKNKIKRKSGISLMVLVVAIVVMIIVLTSAVIIGKQNIDDAKYDEYINNLNRVSNEVNQYYLSNKKLPTTSEIVLKETIEDATFIEKVEEKNDMDNELYIVNIDLLNDSTINIGKGNKTSNDIFVVAKNTHNIYYLKGFKYKGNTIYTNN